MITTSRIISGWPSELPALKGKTFEFSPKLTVLFGPNGCGKTTLLQATAGFTGCPDHGGWSAFVSPMDDRVKREKPDPREPWRTGIYEYPERFRNRTPGGASVELGWDGVPAFLHLPAKSDTTQPFYFEQPHDLLGDGFGLFDEQRRGSRRASSGQLRAMRLEQLFSAVQKPPEIKVRQTNVNEVWMQPERDFVAYANSLRSGLRTKRVPTVFMDEPDRSLDLDTQMRFWTNVVPKFVESGVQVIISTHSIFALFSKKLCPNAVEIDLVEGYAETAREGLFALTKP